MRKMFSLVCLGSVVVWSLYIAQFRWLSILAEIVSYR